MKFSAKKVKKYLSMKIIHWSVFGFLRDRVKLFLNKNNTTLNGKILN